MALFSTPLAHLEAAYSDAVSQKPADAYANNHLSQYMPFSFIDANGPLVDLRLSSQY